MNQIATNWVLKGEAERLGFLLDKIVDYLGMLQTLDTFRHILESCLEPHRLAWPIRRPVLEKLSPFKDALGESDQKALSSWLTGEPTYWEALCALDLPPEWSLKAFRYLLLSDQMDAQNKAGFINDHTLTWIGTLLSSLQFSSDRTVLASRLAEILPLVSHQLFRMLISTLHSCRVSIVNLLPRLVTYVIEDTELLVYLLEPSNDNGSRAVLYEFLYTLTMPQHQEARQRLVGRILQKQRADLLTQQDIRKYFTDVNFVKIYEACTRNAFLQNDLNTGRYTLEQLLIPMSTNTPDRIIADVIEHCDLHERHPNIAIYLLTRYWQSNQTNQIETYLDLFSAKKLEGLLTDNAIPQEDLKLSIFKSFYHQKRQIPHALFVETPRLWLNMLKAIFETLSQSISDASRLLPDSADDEVVQFLEAGLKHFGMADNIQEQLMNLVEVYDVWSILDKWIQKAVRKDELRLQQLIVKFGHWLVDKWGCTPGVDLLAFRLLMMEENDTYIRQSERIQEFFKALRSLDSAKQDKRIPLNEKLRLLLEFETFIKNPILSDSSKNLIVQTFKMMHTLKIEQYSNQYWNKFEKSFIRLLAGNVLNTSSTLLCFKFLNDCIQDTFISNIDRINRYKHFLSLILYHNQNNSFSSEHQLLDIDSKELISSILFVPFANASKYESDHEIQKEWEDLGKTILKLVIDRNRSIDFVEDMLRYTGDWDRHSPHIFKLFKRNKESLLSIPKKEKRIWNHKLFKK